MTWKHTVFWGGLRGAIPIALALSLYETEGFETVSAMTFGVVVFSLVVQGLTLEMFVRRVFGDAEWKPVEDRVARYIAAKSAEYELGRAIESGKIAEPLAAEVVREIQEEVQSMRKELENISETEWMKRRIKRYVLDAKKGAVRDAVSRGVISQEVARKIIEEIDSEISRIEEEQS